MNPDFSERQYETAINQELTAGLKAMLARPLPVVPSTQEEHSLGWDAKFDLGAYWYFLQYKVARHATRRTGQNAPLWDAHSRDYFRFDLLSNFEGFCHQHQRLTELRAVQPGVYYCAPYFVRDADLWAHAEREQVFWQSALIDLATVRISSYKAPHKITYDLDGKVRVWSEDESASSGDRSPQILRRPENLRRLRSETVANLVRDAAVIASELETADEGRVLPIERIVRRLPAQTRQRVGEELSGASQDDLVSALTEALSLAELIPLAGLLLAQDFDLVFVIEPADL